MIMFTINKFLMTFTALFNQIIDSQFGFIFALTRTQKTKYLYYLNHVISKLIIDDYLISTNIFTFNNNCLPSVINKADHFDHINLQADLYIIDKKNESKKKKKSKTLTLFTIMDQIIFRQANKPFLLIYNLYNHLIYNFSVIYHLDNLENHYKCNDFHSLKSFKSIFTIFSIHSDTLKIINTQKKNLAIEKNHWLNNRWLNNRYKNDIQGLEDNSLNKLNKKTITIENGTTRLRSVK